MLNRLKTIFARSAAQTAPGKKELLSRADYLCSLPFLGFVVNSQGEITLCCERSYLTMGNIKDIPDLKKFYNGEKMEYVRGMMEKRQIDKLERCDLCHRHFQTFKNAQSLACDTFDPDWFLRKSDRDRPIRYLECTCSNQCNQMCATCNSFFCSRWIEEDKKLSREQRTYFDRPEHPRLHQLSDKDVQKIIAVLPDLNTLVLKGGEPMADPGSVKILQAAAKSKQLSRIFVITNFQHVPDNAWQAFQSLSKTDIEVVVCVSMDGVGKVYDWVRGGCFEKTVANMEKLYELTAFQVNLIPFISFFNFFDITNILDYFENKPFVSCIDLNNLSEWPNYIQFQVLPKQMVEKQVARILKRCNASKKVRYNALTAYAGKHRNPTTLTHCFDWLDKVDEIRGGHLEDYVPELNAVRNGDRELVLTHDPAYDIWLHWSVAQTCNLNCEYCIAPERQQTSPEIKIPLLLKNLDDTGFTFKIVFTGNGEPFMVPNFVEACIQLSKKHFLGIITNLTSKQVMRFAEKVNPERVDFMICSLHLVQLEKRDLMDRWVQNYLYLRQKGFKTKVQAVAYPPLLKEITRYQKLYSRFDIKFKFTPFAGMYNGQSYPESYNADEIACFGLNPDEFNIHAPCGTLCNAGYNICVVYPDGRVAICIDCDLTIGHIYSKMKFKDSMIQCHEKKCVCPLHRYDNGLYEKALKKQQTTRGNTPDIKQKVTAD